MAIVVRGDWKQPTYEPKGKIVVMANPYHIEKRGRQFVVVKTATGEAVPGGAHSTKEKAVKHLYALEANVKDA